MATPIDPSISSAAALLAAQGASTRRLDASLAKLSAAQAVRPLERPDAGDAATLRGSNVLDAVDQASPLRELGGRLIDLRRLVAEPSRATSIAALQPALDKAAASIDAVADRGVLLGALIFEGPSLDLRGEKTDAEARLTVDLSGPYGTQEVSFASGVSIANIAETLDIVGEDLGVSARLSGSAVVIESDAREGQELAGVRVIDDADANFAPWEGSAVASLREAIESGAGATDPSQLLTLIDDAIRETERAERGVLLSRDTEGIAVERGDIPVIREAQAKLIEEARRLGLVAQPDPNNTYDALKP